MKAQKGIFMVMGVMVALFILIGCTANPTSSTLTAPNDNQANPEPFYTTDEPCDQDNVCSGNEATTTTGLSKFENDNENAEPQPVYPN